MVELTIGIEIRVKEISSEGEAAVCEISLIKLSPFAGEFISTEETEEFLPADEDYHTDRGAFIATYFD